MACIHLNVNVFFTMLWYVDIISLHASTVASRIILLTSFVASHKTQDVIECDMEVVKFTGVLLNVGL